MSFDWCLSGRRHTPTRYREAVGARGAASDCPQGGRSSLLRGNEFGNRPAGSTLSKRHLFGVRVLSAGGFCFAGVSHTSRRHEVPSAWGSTWWSTSVFTLFPLRVAGFRISWDPATEVFAKCITFLPSFKLLVDLLGWRVPHVLDDTKCRQRGGLSGRALWCSPPAP